MESLTINSKVQMNQYIKSCGKTNLKLKDFEFSRNPKISVQAQIFSSEKNGKTTKSKFLQINKFDKQIYKASSIYSPKNQTLQSTTSAPSKLSSNIARNIPTKSIHFSQFKPNFTSDNDDSLQALIESEIEKLHRLNEKCGPKSCPACSSIFENSIFMNNHYFAFHQTFN